jgi:hypothetical protein
VGREESRRGEISRWAAEGYGSLKEYALFLSFL